LVGSAGQKFIDLSKIWGAFACLKLVEDGGGRCLSSEACCDLGEKWLRPVLEVSSPSALLPAAMRHHALLLYIVVLYARGNIDEALKHGRCLVRDHPLSFKAHFLLGSVIVVKSMKARMTLEDFFSMVTHLERAVELSRLDVCFLTHISGLVVSLGMKVIEHSTTTTKDVASVKQVCFDVMSYAMLGSALSPIFGRKHASATTKCVDACDWEAPLRLAASFIVDHGLTATESKTVLSSFEKCRARDDVVNEYSRSMLRTFKCHGLVIALSIFQPVLISENMRAVASPLFGKHIRTSFTTPTSSCSLAAFTDLLDTRALLASYTEFLRPLPVPTTLPQLSGMEAIAVSALLSVREASSSSSTNTVLGKRKRTTTTATKKVVAAEESADATASGS
jgi:hypothetical protein